MSSRRKNTAEFAAIYMLAYKNVSPEFINFKTRQIVYNIKKCEKEKFHGG
jgi:hypothetical protein